MIKKKTLSLFLASSMVFTMATTALADDPVTPDIDGIQVSDVTLDQTAWYMDAVNFALTEGYMTNLDNGFEPDKVADRATIFNALYMVEGSPTVEPSTFVDVEGKWYAAAAAWAEDIGLSNGDGAGNFLGDNNATRAEIATILYRFAEYKGIVVPTGDLSTFEDTASLPEWAIEGMTACVALGVINGTLNTNPVTGEERIYLSPNTNTTRAELATLLMNFDTSVGALGAETIMVTNGDREIPTVVKMPTNTDGVPVPAVVMIHGHGGSKSENGGFESIATELAMAGYATIRLDFAGCGESTASFQENYISNMVSDVEAALGYLGANFNIDTDRIGVLGYSMGGRIAMEFLTDDDNPFAAAILLAGSVDDGEVSSVGIMGGQESYDAFYAEAEENGFAAVPWFGNTLEVSLEWFDEMNDSEPLKNADDYEGPVLIIAGEADTTVPMSVAEEAMEALPQHESLIIPEADHGYGFYSDQPEVTRILEEGIVSFIKKELPPAYTISTVSLSVEGTEDFAAHEVPGILTLPTADDYSDVPAVVMLHGTGSNKNEAGNGYDMAAMALAEAGIASLRIDFMGNGDSTASYVDYSYTSANADAFAAAEYLAEMGIDDIGIMGWSQGGTNALVAAATYPEVFDAVLTWAGATDLKNALRYTEGFEEAYAMAVEDGSYTITFDWRSDLEVGPKWFEDVLATDIIAVTETIEAPLLAINGELDTVVLPEEAEKIADAAQDGDEIILDDADHTFNIFTGDFTAINELLTITTEFFSDNLK